MNNKLTDQIVRHIFSNLGIIKNNVSTPLNNKDYLLPIKLTFDENGQIVSNSVWGCQFIIDKKILRILLGEASSNNEEYYLIVHLEGSPTYGIFLSMDEEIKQEALIACSVSNKDWMQCNIYLQATFLAAMEQIKDIGIPQQKCLSYKEEYQSMVSFVDYQSSCEDDNEGQET